MTAQHTAQQGMRSLETEPAGQLDFDARPNGHEHLKPKSAAAVCLVVRLAATKSTCQTMGRPSVPLAQQHS